MPYTEAQLRQQVAIDQQMTQIERLRPSLWYTPSRPNAADPYGAQLYFHQSQHPVRFMCPGNGWGKSCAMGHEANAWATHSNRWQKTTAGTVSMIWFGPGLSQWQKVRKELLEPYCFDTGYRYKKGDHAYEWEPSANHAGGRLEFRSYEAGWSVEQGINPDVIFFDELPPWDLFREMELRRRGARKTRLVVAATQTMGSSWMEEVLYNRWLNFHAGLGLDEEGAMAAQKHDYIWCWPRGGIRSNPSMTSEDYRHYEENIVYSSDEEKRVRLYGGFGDWNGAAVFDLAGVRWLQEEAKKLHALHEAAVKQGGARIFHTLNGTILPKREAA